MTREKKQGLISSIVMLLMALTWGLAFVIVKNSLDNVPPIYVICFRFTIAFIGMVLIFIKQLKYINKKILLQGSLLGLFLFLAFLTQTIGLKYTTAGKNAFLTTTYVFLTPFLGIFVLKRKLTWRSVVASVVAIIGLGCISLNNDFSINYGDVLSLICGICFAIQITFTDKFISMSPAIPLTIVQLGCCSILSWILAPIFDGAFPIHSFNSSMVFSMLYLGIICTMFGYLGQTICQKYVKSATASLILSSESVFAVIFSVLFLHEIMSVRVIVGCIITFCAIIFAQLRSD